MLAMLLCVACSLSFLKFVGWAATYSDILGLPTKLAKVEFAHGQARLFLWIFLLFEGLMTWVMASLIRLEGMSSDNFRIVARCIVALAFSLFATGILIWLISSVGGRLGL